MDCQIVLQITNYDHESKTKKHVDGPDLGTMPEDQKLTIDVLTQAIVKLNKDQRMDLAAKLKAAKSQSLTQSDFTKKTTGETPSKFFMSNITLNDLVVRFPDLAKYKIPHDLSYTFNLIYCNQAVFDHKICKGRIIDANGEETFIINNIWDAETLFRNLSAKLNLIQYIQGDEIDEKLKIYADDLTKIAKHYHRSVQRLIEDYINDKHAFNSFKSGDQLYSPKTIINKVLQIITNSVYDEGDKSKLQLELEAIKEKDSTSNEWKFDKKRLYDVLSTFYEDFAKTYDYNQFKSLDTAALNNLLQTLFVDDIKLMKATVQSSTYGEQIIKTPKVEKRLVDVSKTVLQKLYKTIFQLQDPELPKTYEEAAEKYGYRLIASIKKALSNGPLIATIRGKDREIHIEMDEDKVLSAFYEEIKEPVITEKNSYIILNLHNWSPIGEIFNFGYETQHLFSFVKQYKGFYIYEYNKDGSVVYAVSRNVISPKAFMKQFSSLDYAQEYIDSNKDTLKSHGLWSIKQFTSRPRRSKLEMGNVREGQIISTLDLELPSYSIDSFSSFVKNLFDGTVNDFHEQLDFIPNIKELNSPEQAVAFIYLTQQALRSDVDYKLSLKAKPQIVSDIITKILEAKPIHYLVEKEVYGKGGKEYILQLLPSNEKNNFTKEGSFEDMSIQDFLDRNLTDAIEYFNKTFNIKIHAITRSELEELNKSQNLGLEKKLEVIKAFVLNGEIYINTSNANVENLFHELSHIFLGVLKAKDINMYQEVINNYIKNSNRFSYMFSKHQQTYKHYAEQDIIEEAIADMIAEDLFQSKVLGGSVFEGEAITKMFQNILQKSQRFLEISDNELGFINYINQLLDENSNKIQRNMKISELVRSYIEDGIINEVCEE